MAGSVTLSLNETEYIDPLVRINNPRVRAEDDDEAADPSPTHRPWPLLEPLLVAILAPLALLLVTSVG
jgi:hypothetical protein